MAKCVKCGRHGHMHRDDTCVFERRKTPQELAARITALETALRETRDAVKAAYKEGRDAGLCERYDFPTDADEHFAWEDSEAKAFLDGSAIPSCGEI